jgi:hypothetical protein
MIAINPLFERDQERNDKNKNKNKNKVNWLEHSN